MSNIVDGTKASLTNKFFLIKSDDPFSECFERTNATLFKIVNMEEMTSHAAYLVTINPIAGPLNSLGEFVGNVAAGQVYKVSYKTASTLITVAKDNINEFVTQGGQ